MENILKLRASRAEAGEICEVGGKRYICAYWDGGTDAAAPDSIVRGQVVVLGYNTGATSAPKNPFIITPATEADYQYIAVAPEAYSAAGWYWWQTKGECEALVDGDANDVTVGDFLEVLNAATAFTLDHATARSSSSAAVAVDANAGAAALKTVWLIGDPVVVAGS